VREHEWDYWPQPEGEPFEDDGNEVLGWQDRSANDDVDALCAAFEAYAGRPVLMRPVLVRDASEVECKIHGYEEGTFVRCTTRAKHPRPMWQIEVAPTQQEPN
jgi:hypothetical protein